MFLSHLFHRLIYFLFELPPSRGDNLSPCEWCKPGAHGNGLLCRVQFSQMLARPRALYIQRPSLVLLKNIVFSSLYRWKLSNRGRQKFPKEWKEHRGPRLPQRKDLHIIDTEEIWNRNQKGSSSKRKVSTGWLSIPIWACYSVVQLYLGWMNKHNGPTKQPAKGQTNEQTDKRTKSKTKILFESKYIYLKIVTMINLCRSTELTVLNSLWFVHSLIMASRNVEKL